MANNNSNKKQADQEKALQDARRQLLKYVDEISGNFQAMKSAEYALRQISKVGSYNFNVVMSDKDFTKELIADVQAIDGIQTKLVSKMGSPDLIENLQAFTEGLSKIQKQHKEFIESFFEKEIGNGRDLNNYKKQKAKAEKQKDETAKAAEDKTEDKTKKTAAA